MKHWTDRIIKWANAHRNQLGYDGRLVEGHMIIVHRDSDDSPYVGSKTISLHVGIEWIRDNYPQPYAQFMAEFIEMGGWKGEDNFKSAKYASPSYKRLIDKQVSMYHAKEIDFRNKQKIVQVAGKVLTKPYRKI